MRTWGHSEHALCLRRMILDRSLNIGGTLVLAGRWFSTKRDCGSHIEIMVREAQPLGEGCHQRNSKLYRALRPGRHGRQRACRGYVAFLDPSAGRSNCRTKTARPCYATGGGTRPALKKCPRGARKVKHSCSAKLARGNKVARLPSLPPPEVAGFAAKRRRLIRLFNA